MRITDFIIMDFAQNRDTKKLPFLMNEKTS